MRGMVPVRVRTPSGKTAVLYAGALSAAPALAPAPAPSLAVPSQVTTAARPPPGSGGPGTAASGPRAEAAASAAELGGGAAGTAPRPQERPAPWKGALEALEEHDEATGTEGEGLEGGPESPEEAGGSEGPGGGPGGFDLELRPGDAVYRHGELASVVHVDRSLDPPGYTVRMQQTGQEVGCEGHHLVAASTVHAVDSDPSAASDVHITCQGDAQEAPSFANAMHVQHMHQVNGRGYFHGFPQEMQMDQVTQEWQMDPQTDMLRQAQCMEQMYAVQGFQQQLFGFPLPTENLHQWQMAPQMGGVHRACRSGPGALPLPLPLSADGLHQMQGPHGAQLPGCRGTDAPAMPANGLHQVHSLHGAQLQPSEDGAGREDPFANPMAVGSFADTVQMHHYMMGYGGAEQCSQMPQGAGQYSQMPQGAGHYSQMPQGAGQYSQMPQGAGQYSQMPQGAGQYSQMPQGAGQYSQMPQGAGQYSQMPQDAGQYSQMLRSDSLPSGSRVKNHALEALTEALDRAEVDMLAGGRRHPSRSCQSMYDAPSADIVQASRAEPNYALQAAREALGTCEPVRDHKRRFSARFTPELSRNESGQDAYLGEAAPLPPDSGERPEASEFAPPPVIHAPDSPPHREEEPSAAQPVPTSNQGAMSLQQAADPQPRRLALQPTPASRGEVQGCNAEDVDVRLAHDPDLDDDDQELELMAKREMDEDEVVNFSGRFPPRPPLGTARPAPLGPLMPTSVAAAASSKCRAGKPNTDSRERQRLERRDVLVSCVLGDEPPGRSLTPRGGGGGGARRSRAAQLPELRELRSRSAPRISASVQKRAPSPRAAAPAAPMAPAEPRPGLPPLLQLPQLPHMPLPPEAARGRPRGGPGGSQSARAWRSKAAASLYA